MKKIIMMAMVFIFTLPAISRADTLKIAYDTPWFPFVGFHDSEEQGYALEIIKMILVLHFKNNVQVRMI